MARIVFLLALLVAGRGQAGVVELISRSNGAAGPPKAVSGGGFAWGRSLSADGRYFVFQSQSVSVVPGVVDGNGPTGTDVFVYDRQADVTTLVTASSSDPARSALFGGTQASISADGRWVVFTGGSQDLVPGLGVNGGFASVFLWDRLTSTTRLVSHSRAGALQPANQTSESPVVSEDGKWVAFESLATDFLPGQVPGGRLNWNIYLWESDTGQIRLVSHVPGNPIQAGSASGDSEGSRISADGSKVVFWSTSPDLAPLAGSNVQVYAWDRTVGEPVLVSHAAGLPGTAANGWSNPDDLSADGRFVAFESDATNVVAGQTGPKVKNVFLWDSTTGATVLVSHQVGSPLAGGDATSEVSSVSANGGAVAFTSASAGLVAGFADGNGPQSDVFVFDRISGAVSLVSRKAGSSTMGSNGGSSSARLSSDGTRVAFTSGSSDLMAVTDTNGDSDVFLFDRGSSSVTLASHIVGLPLTTGNHWTASLDLSADGRVVAFQTAATDLFGPAVVDANGLGDLGLYESAGGTVAFVTKAAEGGTGTSDQASNLTITPGARSVSADGRWVVWLSASSNVVPGQSGASPGSVFLTDRWSRTSTLVSHAFGGATTVSNGFSGTPAMSADGRWIAYGSSSTNLVGSPTAGNENVFVFDRLSGQNRLVSHGPAGVAGSADSWAPVVSDDGNWIVFPSMATDLVGGADSTGTSDVFLYDRAADVVALVSHRVGSVNDVANGESTGPVISADGAWIAFVSQASNLTAGEAGGLQGIYVLERATKNVTLVSHVAGLPSLRADGRPSRPVLGADGRFLAYQSEATNLVAGETDTNTWVDVFSWDRLTGITVLVSHAAGDFVKAGNGGGSGPYISDDGRVVAFSSASTDLVPAAGAAPGVSNAYVWDRTSAAVSLVSRTPAGTAGSDFSGVVALSADGSRVAINSRATNLVPGFAARPVPTLQYFLFDRASATVELASGPGGAPAISSDGESFNYGFLSANGGVFVFDSSATNLVPGDANGASDVFAYVSIYAAPPSGFATLTPCRVVDTRVPAGPWGAPALAAVATRRFALAGRCGVPSDAVAVSANLTVVAPAADGALAFYPAGFAAGGTSTMSFRAGQTRANNAVLGLGANGSTAVDLGSPGPADLVIDVNGYFK